MVKKIILIHPIFKVFGGAEKLILELFNELKKEYNTELYTLFDDPLLHNKEKIYFATHKNPCFTKLFGYKINPFNNQYIKKLGDMIAKKYKPGTVIMFTNFPGSFVLQEALKLNPNIAKGKNIFLSFEPDRILYYNELKKLNYLPKDLFSFKFKIASLLLSDWKKRDYNIIKKHITKIITISDYVTKQTKSIYKTKQVKKEADLYVNTNQSASLSKKNSLYLLNKNYKFNIKKEDFIIFSISRLEKSKGLIELVNAFIDLENKGICKNMKLLIGGKGNLMNKLKKITKKSRNIFLLGFVPDELLPHLYNSADLFVTLARKETGGPLTILEAMYYKTIIIGTNEAGPKEIIKQGENGFLVNPNNQNEIINSIKKVYLIKKNNYNKYKSIGNLNNNTINLKYTFKNFYKSIKEQI